MRIWSSGRLSGLFVLLAAGLLAACGDGEDAAEPDTDEAAEATQAEEAEQEEPSFVTLDGIDTFLRNIDETVQRQDTAWLLRVRGHPVYVISDPPADRIRIQVPVTQASRLDPGDWQRVMSANFDTAIDARYAAAQNVLWTVFVHRLSTLTEQDFVSGLRQCLNLMATYGTAYASMNQAFTGGDLYEEREGQAAPPGNGGGGK